MWNAVTGAVEAELRSSGPAVSRVSFSPDGQRVVSAASDGSVVLWDGSGKQVAQLPSGMVSALAWSAGGQRLALAQAGGMVRVLDGRTGSLVREWSTQAQGQVQQQAARAMGLRLAPALDLVDSGARGQVWAAPQGPGGLQSRQQGQDATRAPELSVASQAGEAQATSRGKAQQPTRALTNHSHQTTQAIWAWLASALGLSHGGACGQTGEVSHGPVDSQSQLQGQDATTATEMTAVSAAGEAHARSRGQAQQATYAQTNPSQQAMRAQANLDQEAVPGQTRTRRWGAPPKRANRATSSAPSLGWRRSGRRRRSRGLGASWTRRGSGLMQRTALGLAQGQVTIGALGLSPDGRRLVAAGFGASARVWDVDSGQQVFELKGTSRTDRGRTVQLGRIAHRHGQSGWLGAGLGRGDGDRFAGARDWEWRAAVGVVHAGWIQSAYGGY